MRNLVSGGTVVVMLLSVGCGGSHTLRGDAGGLFDAGDAGGLFDAGDAGGRFDAGHGSFDAGDAGDVEAGPVTPTDAGPPVPCTWDHFPESGEPCTPLPSGYVCRELDCRMDCRSTCDCVDGRWWCVWECRDPYDDGGPPPPSCGVAPLCYGVCP